MAEEQRESLSERELELVRLLSQGLSNREIANRLVISPNTVKVHLRNIYAKLNVSSRTEASMLAVRQGWVQVETTEGEVSGEELPQVADEPVEGAEFPGGLAELSADRSGALALWQRIYMAATLVAVVIGLVLIWPARGERTAPFTDRPATASSWSPSTFSRWTGLVQMPTPRGRLAVAARGSDIYAIGGEGAAGTTGVVEVYVSDQDSWSRGADKPTAVANIGAVAIGGKLFVPGGSTADGQISDLLEVYDPDAGERGAWSQAERMPEGRSAYALAGDAEALYVLGGWDGQAYVATVFRYDAAADEWSQLASMPTPRAFSGAGRIGETIYVVGGYDGQDELATCEAYDIPSDSWSACPAMHAPRGGIGVTVIADTLYVVGGGWNSYLVENEYYSPAQGSWTPFYSPLLKEWRNLGVTSNETFLYAIGGWGGDFLGTNQAYRARYRLYMPGALGQGGSP